MDTRARNAEPDSGTAGLKIMRSPSSVDADGFFGSRSASISPMLPQPEPRLYELPSPNAPISMGIIRVATAKALAVEVHALSES